MKKKKLWIFASLIIILVIIIGSSYLNSMFTSKRWINNPDIRYRMIDDLENNYSLIGKDKQNIISLLGEPDVSWQHDFDNGHYVYFQYYIGSERELFEFMDESHIYLIAFCNGYVVSTSVQ